MIAVLLAHLVCFAKGHLYWPIVCTRQPNGDLLRTCLRCKRAG